MKEISQQYFALNKGVNILSKATPEQEERFIHRFEKLGIEVTEESISMPEIQLTVSRPTSRDQW